ncbi:MAG: hypothetical protein HC927_00005 [Deltaproteobacteria bacterium]|nr:hypothetical protein [Deltaproteobacteria bacterium]
MASDPDERWLSLAELIEHIDATLAEVQPGLFTGLPRELAIAAPPIMIVAPLAWLALEQLGVVAYAPENWAWLSGAQILAMATIAFAVRGRLVDYLGDPRTLAAPGFLTLFVVGHRGIALTLQSSIEAMFAYDYLALFGLVGITIYLAERTLWPVLGLPLTLLLVTLLRPEWGPRAWAGFTIGVPLLVIASIARSRRRMAQGMSRTRNSGSRST